mmetsp:Transcript_38237/g.113343  ORF Transcript_38237/g.113343 Transcript_38237/m.113343 type:complete len:220 (+) Transcript_38237:110-769(+)
MCDCQRHQRSTQDACSDAEEGPRALQPFTPERGMLHQEDHRRAKLPADGDSLHQAQQQQHHGRSDACLLVRGQTAHQEGGHRHAVNAGQKRCLAGHRIPDPTKKQRSEWSCEEAGGEDAIDAHIARVDIRLGKEQAGEHNTHVCVHQEVVPLQQVAHHRGRHNDKPLKMPAGAAAAARPCPLLVILLLVSAPWVRSGGACCWGSEDVRGGLWQQQQPLL